jgi:lantibiotic biosynthesis protein
VTALTRNRLAAAASRIARGDRPALAEFDLIRGLTGLGAHLWRHDPHGDLITDVLGYLVTLTEPLDGLPGWWTASPARRGSTDPPGGHGNNGMAHGITGPLSLLSITARSGLRVPGHLQAIGRICDWLDQWQQEHREAPWWPETITLADFQRGNPSQPGPMRPSWCYGTPGIARAQQLAAIATGDTARRRSAGSAITGCLSDPAQLARITDQSVCHGTAGLFMTVTAFAADTADPSELPLPAIGTLLLDGPAVPGTPPGFLTGSAGYALALEVLASGAPAATTWDSCLLLR